MRGPRSDPATVGGGLRAPSAGPGLFVIQNPAAGTSRAERLRRRIAAILDARTVQHCFAYTSGPGDAEVLAREALDRGWDRIAVAGGDGTVLEVSSALAGTGVALALIPTGTGNQLAANLGVPRDLARAVELAVLGPVRTIDVGLIGDRTFTIMAGAGFDARVIRTDPRLKRRVGYLAYVGSALHGILFPPRASIRVVVDGREIRYRGMGVEVANMPGLWAPGFARPVRMLPDARIDDGRLGILLLAVERRGALLRALISIVRGRPQRDSGLRFDRGSEILVESEPPLAVQADGEQIGTTPFRARIWPAALNVVVPPDRASGPAEAGGAEAGGVRP